MNALNNNKDDFIVLCLFIANLFQPINENSKKNFIYIHGPSNTGKTTYSTKVLSRYFGSENIGSIVGDSNFKFQDIQDKLFIILEEFKYKNSLSGEFLKLLGGERLLTSKKYSKNHISLENLKGLIISNNLIIYFATEMPQIIPLSFAKSRALPSVPVGIAPRLLWSPSPISSRIARSISCDTSGSLKSIG